MQALCLPSSWLPSCCSRVLERGWSFWWYAQSITQSFPVGTNLVVGLSLLWVETCLHQNLWRNVSVFFYSPGCRKEKTFFSWYCLVRFTFPLLLLLEPISLHKLTSHLVHAETYRLWVLMKTFGIRWFLNWNISGWKASNILSGKSRMQRFFPAFWQGLELQDLHCDNLFLPALILIVLFLPSLSMKLEGLCCL